MANQFGLARFRALTSGGALCVALCCLGPGQSGRASAGTVHHRPQRQEGVYDATFTTIDAPGAGTGPNQGTYAFSINTAGAITGYYIDTISVFHSFVRSPSGTLTTFDAPARAQAPIKALPPIASTPQAPSREPTVTQTGCITASCEPPRDPLQLSMFRVSAQAAAKARSPSASTPRAPSRDTTSIDAGPITALCEAPLEPLLDSTLPEPAQASAMALPHGPSTTRVSSRESTWTQVRYRTAS